MAYAVLAGEPPVAPEPAPVAGLRLGIPQGLPLADLDASVTAGFAAAVAALAKAGARISEETIALFDDLRAANAKGGFASPEAFAIHRARLARSGAGIDPNVRVRIERGSEMSAADYVDLVQDQARLRRGMDARMADLDALILPTTPIVAPKLADVATSDAFSARNFALLRNTGMVNFFDLCAISLPIRRDGLSIGLMLVARNGHDHRLFRLAAAAERVLSG
jgi:aspartyl-tRNA(Asn)/glutamyl-tRNA(Gln) amidotransferase subunit A